MTIDSATQIRTSHSRCPCWVLIAMTLVAALFAANALAQAPAAPGNTAPALTSEELEKLVAPIALYPDDLVAIILPASTNPLQLVQAERFLDKRKADPKLPVDEDWDDAVKSLLNYPEIVKSMSGDLDWTSALGEAVVADQGAVLEAVQVFRRKVHAAGNLKSDDKQVVVVEKEVITIVPANPEVIYVPQYNPATVVVYGGYSSWNYWPTPYPVYYYPYPPGAAIGVGIIWGAAIGAAWHGGHYVTHYGGGGTANINIDRNTNININRPGSPSQLPAGGGSKWKSDKQPGQVSSAVGKTPSTRVGDTRPGGGDFGSAGGAGRPTTQPAGGGAAARGRSNSISTSNMSTKGSAFGGYSSGRQTQMNSSRGAASRSSMSGGGARAGGGARGGGGGRR